MQCDRISQRQLVASQAWINAFCRGGCGERSCLRSTTASHPVAVNRTPNLLIGRWTLYRS